MEKVTIRGPVTLVPAEKYIELQQGIDVLKKQVRRL